MVFSKRFFTVLPLLAWFIFFFVNPGGAQEIRREKLSRESVKALQGHNGTVLSVALSPDGSTAATGSIDRSVILWDTQTGDEKRRIRAAGINALAFNDDATVLATGSRDKEITLWNTKTGERVKNFPNHASNVTGLAIRGKHLVFGLDNGQAGVRDLDTGKPLHPLNEHSRSITAVAVAMRKSVAVFASQDRTATVWDLVSGKRLSMFKEHQGAVESAALNSWGTRVVTGSADRTAAIWDCDTGKILHRLEGHAAPVTFVAFAPDNVTVYTASAEGTFIQWNANTGKEVVRCEAGFPVARAAVSRDAFYTIAAGTDQTPFVFRTDALRFTAPRQPPPTGKGPFAHLLAPDEPVLRLNPLQKPAPTRITVSQKTPQDPLSTEPVGNFVAFHPTKPWCMTVGADKNGALWNLEDGETLRRFACSTAFTAVAAQPRGNFWAAGARDGSMLFLHSETCEILRNVRGHTRTIHAIAFSADGTRLLTAGEDRNLVFWDAATGKSLGIFQGHKGPVHAVAITVTAAPDQARAVSVSADRTVRVWKIEDKSSVVSEEQSSPLISLALSPDGSWFAVGEAGNDKETGKDKGKPAISLWDFETLKPVAKLGNLPSLPRTLAVSPDGRILASGGVDGTVVFWDVKTRKPFRAFPQIPREVAEKMEAEAVRSAELKQWYRFRLDDVTFEPIRQVAFNKDTGKDTVLLVSSGGRDTLFYDVSKLVAPSIQTEQAEQRQKATGGRKQDQPDIESLPAGRLVLEVPDAASPILDSSLNRDGSRFSVCLSSKSVLLFSADTGKEISRFTARSAFQTCQYLPDARTLLAGGEDGRFFSVNTITEKTNYAVKVHTDRITCLAVTPTGSKAVTGGDDRMAVIWDTKKGENLGRLTGEHKEAVNGVAINRDGSRILTGSEDRRAILWDVKTLKPIHTLNDHRGPVHAVAFSPDGNRFVTASADRTAIVYQTATGKELVRLQGTEPFTSVEFSPSGDFLLTGDEGAQAVLWNGVEGKALRRFPARYKAIREARFFNNEKRLLVTDPRTVLVYETGIE